MRTQFEKAAAFRTLHDRKGAFILPNPWDIGSAKVLSHIGFEALATTSMGHAFSMGRLDNSVESDKVLQHVFDIVGATDLPVSADLGNGFGGDAETVAETILGAAEAGAVGGSIEDSTGDGSHPIYAFEPAVDRIRAAVAAARTLPFPFIVTARAENFLHGRDDLIDTIKRLLAFEEAGADVLYAPGLRSREQIAAVVGAVNRPVNVVMGLQGARLSLAELEEIGVKRVSMGSTLCRTAFGALLRAAREMRQRGTFDFAAEAVSPQEVECTFMDGNA